MLELVAELFGLVAVAVVLCSDPNLKTNDDDLFASCWAVAAGFSAAVAV